MLKELVDNDLVDPTYVSMLQVKPNHFQIQIKCGYRKEEIEKHAKKYGLTISEDKDQRYLLVFKP
jgi:hypothetical protein